MNVENLICLGCKHWREFGIGCDAFPEGVPETIIRRNKHDRKIKGQKNDLTFKKR